MPEILVRSKEVSGSKIRVDVGTNCPQEGDGSYGARTLLRFIDYGLESMMVGINDEDPIQTENVEIVIWGNSDCSALIEALEFATETLKSQLNSSMEEETVD